MNPHLILFILVGLLNLLNAGIAHAQFSGGGTAVGYIDSAPIRDQIRFRFDGAYGNSIPDWAEFFYPKCGCFRVSGADPNAPGPPLAETNVDYQEFQLYAEHVFVEGMVSGFVELPFRLVNPEVNANAGGISDVNAGVRVSLYDDEIQHLTFQFRTFIPTGDSERGLGTDHVTLEPGLLYLRQIADGTTLEAELRDFIPIGGTAWAGNVLRYGVGISHRLIEGENVYVAPVVEAVGWSILNGRGLDPATGPTDAATTIVNLKVGARIGLGNPRNANAGSQSLYVGYGRALTGRSWYDNVVRAEFRVMY